ncbi:MAG TPA: PEP-CTERM system histidine kinase PrsK [Nitrospiraceae bacterium]|nr:PEP-CTERM system histidine kinase PrsK [Nitrospiraceae bacterium]
MMKYIDVLISLMPILSALLSCGLGILVFIRNPRHPANLSFGLGMLTLTFIEGGNAIFVMSGDEAWSILGKRVSITGEAFLPSAWFLFSLTFARASYKEIISRWKPILAVLYLTSISFIFLIKSPNFAMLQYGLEDNSILMIGTIGRYFYIFIILGMIINLIHLENTLRFSSGSRRQQIKYVIAGVGAIFAFQIYLSSKALLFSYLDNSYIPVTSAVILISCGIVLFNVIRQHLFDVDIFISRYVIYNSLTVLIVGAYLLTAGLVAQGIKLAGGSFEKFWGGLFTFTAILIIVFALLSTRLKRKVQHFISAHFYRHKYEFKDKWMETIEKIGTKKEFSQVQKELVDLISETMGAREVYLWIYEPVFHRYHLAASTVTTSVPLHIKEEQTFISYIKRNQSSFLINEIPEDENIITQEIAPMIMASKAVLCTPLIVGKEELIGFILQGPDISGEPYTIDDFDLLRAIANHAASRLKNIRLTQDILAAKEAETFHQVSSFFIHDLKNLVSTLSLLVQNAEEHISNPLFQADAKKTLRDTVSKMNSMISNLSFLSRGLKLSQGPVNVNTIIEETLSTLNGQISSRIEKQLETIPSILADSEQLRKVFLNLLFNAMEASNPGGEILIQTISNNCDVVLSVVDKGCGMSQEFIQSSLFRPFKTTKSKGLGIGLFQCKKIVEAHKGRIEVESEVGKGSIFRVVLPV